MPSNVQVYLDVSIGTKAGGRIVFELFNDVAPQAVENFRALCTGEYGKSQTSGLPLCFKGCRFFKVIPGVMVQSGDIVQNNGEGGESIFGAPFRHESTLRRHCQAGVLSMLSDGRHNNTSKFLVTLKRAPQLDGRHVAFGQVIQGMEVIRAIEKCPIDSHNVPRVPIVIVDCGQQKRPPGVRKNDPKIQMREAVQSLMATLTPKEVETDLFNISGTKRTKPPTSAQIGLQQLQSALKQTQPKNIMEVDQSKPPDVVPSPSPSGASDFEKTSLVHATTSDSETSSEETEEEEEVLDMADARHNALLQLRIRLREGRRLNSKEVADEAKRHMKGQNSRWNVQHELREAMVDLNRALHGKSNQSRGPQDAQLSLGGAAMDGAGPGIPTPPAPQSDDSGSDSEVQDDHKKRFKKRYATGWNLDESAETMQVRDLAKRKKKTNAEKSFGWNAMNSDAFYRAHKKRSANLKFQPAEYEKQLLQLGEEMYTPAGALVSTEFQPTEEAKERLEKAVAADKAKRRAFSRRRMYIEDETVAYINDFNRAFNQKLERAYGAETVEIRQNLERGTAL